MTHHVCPLGQRSRLQCNITYLQQECYNMAAEGLIVRTSKFGVNNYHIGKYVIHFLGH